MQCISRHLQPTIVESALCCFCLEPLFSLGSQTACTQCTSSTLPGVIVPGTGSQPSNTASPNRLRFTFQQKNSMSGTDVVSVYATIFANRGTGRKQSWLTLRTFCVLLIRIASKCVGILISRVAGPDRNPRLRILCFAKKYVKSSLIFVSCDVIVLRMKKDNFLICLLDLLSEIKSNFASFKIKRNLVSFKNKEQI